jgi:ParB family chromosome partitioning protein
VSKTQVLPEKLLIPGLDVHNTDDIVDDRINLPLNQDTVDHIAECGVLQPVLVRPYGTHLIVVDGRQRVRHARAANRLLIEQGREPGLVPFLVRNLTAEEAFEVSIGLNVHRKEEDPVALAKKVKKLFQILTKGEPKASVVFSKLKTTLNCTEQTVKNYLALADMPEPVQQKVTGKEIGVAAALTFQNLPPEKAVEASNLLVESGKTGNVDKAREIRDNIIKRDPGIKPPGKQQLEDSLTLIEFDCIDENMSFGKPNIETIALTIKWVLGKIPVEAMPSQFRDYVWNRVEAGERRLERRNTRSDSRLHEPE